MAEETQSNRYTLVFPPDYKAPTLQLRDKWIEALKSGKYQQGIGVLRNPKTNCYCVLGVYSELQERLQFIPAKEIAEALPPDHAAYRVSESLDIDITKFGMYYEPGYSVNGRAWGGMTTLSPKNPANEVLQSLGIFPKGVVLALDGKNFEIRSISQANDWNITFPELASIIEKIWAN